MSGINDWIVGIVAFIIIMTVVSHLIGSMKFFKYIKFFMGMILILIVINPAGKFFSIENIYNNILNICEEELALSELKAEINTGVGEYTDNIMNVYKETIAETVEGIALEDGYEVAQIDADIDENEESDTYGIIRSIKIYLAKASEETSIKVDKIKVGEEAVNAVSQLGEDIYDKLKTRIAGQFNLDAGNVDIVITGG